MRVICIDAAPRDYPTCKLKEGEVYTVISECPFRLGYILQEVKSDWNFFGSFWKNRFIPLSDIDETQTTSLTQKHERV